MAEALPFLHGVFAADRHAETADGTSLHQRTDRTADLSPQMVVVLRKNRRHRAFRQIFRKLEAELQMRGHPPCAKRPGQWRHEFAIARKFQRKHQRRRYFAHIFRIFWTDAQSGHVKLFAAVFPDTALPCACAFREINHGDAALLRPDGRHCDKHRQKIDDSLHRYPCNDGVPQ